MNKYDKLRIDNLKKTPKKIIEHPKYDKVLEDPFAQWMTFKGIKYIKQYKPFQDRRYRCDFYLPDYNTIIEIEGAQWVNGRHQRGLGFAQDIEKYNLLTFAGYRLIRLTTSHFLRTAHNSYAVSGYSAKILDEIDKAFGKTN